MNSVLNATLIELGLLDSRKWWQTSAEEKRQRVNQFEIPLYTGERKEKKERLRFADESIVRARVASATASVAPGPETPSGDFLCAGIQYIV